MRTHYRIVYYSGDRNLLSVAIVDEYEEDDYEMASCREFDFTETGKVEADAYAKELASANGIRFYGKGEAALLD